ncbi:MAG: hypothetical protein KAR14_08525 [Candidatus Aminicenantes bacterium]|nr:hypothetical protein [Candidatus Aminicenantes bacterium]
MKFKKPTKKQLIKHGLFIGAGALLGFSYYYFIGCRTGTCPITSNPVISITYGSVMGLLISL